MSDTIAIDALLIVAAPFVGSFIGTVVDRSVDETGTGRGWLTGRSVCDHCGEPLAVRDLLPLLSWLLCGGRSRCCGKPLRTFLPAVEMGALTLAAVSVSIAAGATAATGALLGWVLLTLALIDLRSFRLPDAGTLPLLVAGLVMAQLQHPDTVWLYAVGAAVGFISLYGLAVAYRRIRGVEGLGLGDAKMLAAAGAWVGPAGLPWVLVLASLLGLALAVVLHRGESGTLMRMAVPFGPGLAAGFWLTWLCGPAPF